MGVVGSLRKSFQKFIKLTRLDIPILHHIQFGHIELRERSQCRIDGVSIERNDFFLGMAQRLVKHDCNHGFTDATLALQDQVDSRHYSSSLLTCRRSATSGTELS